MAIAAARAEIERSLRASPILSALLEACPPFALRQADAPYDSVEAAVRTFHCPATCVAVRPGAQGLDFCAPYGLIDLVDLTARPNKTLIWGDVYLAKVRRWGQVWPRLG